MLSRRHWGLKGIEKNEAVSVFAVEGNNKLKKNTKTFGISFL